MSEDLIRRSDAVEAIDKALGKVFVEPVGKKIVDGIPTIEPKQGEWIDWLGKGNEWECSVCKCSIESHGSIAYNFCPMCGADMRAEQAEPRTRTDEDGRVWEYRNGNWWQLGKTEPNSSEKPNNCEAQTCDNCKLKGTTKWCDNQVVCRAYKPKTEPQTDCPWR